MANINEFRGLRPKREYVSSVAVLPYDVVSTEEARVLANSNKYSFFHVSKPEIDFSDEIDHHDLKIYGHGSKYLRRLINDGVFSQDIKPCMYLYTQVQNGREQTGLIACVDIDDYINKVVKKHELTREDKEKDRTLHTDIINANTGQVFLFFNDDNSKKNIFNIAINIKPEYDFTSDDGVRQIIRIINDPELISAFKKAFANDVLYIADGHHRAAAAVRVGLQRRKTFTDYNGSEEFNRFMAVIFPHSQLKILPYNRVVRDLNGQGKEEFMNALSSKFTIDNTTETVPGSIHCFCMYLDKGWYMLRPRFSPGGDPIDSLDVKLLQDHILGPELGITDPRNDKRIDFIGGSSSIEKMQESVDTGQFKVGFSLFPTTIEQLMRVSDADKIMPPKSTWFEPKLRSGIVVHLL